MDGNNDNIRKIAAILSQSQSVKPVNNLELNGSLCFEKKNDRDYVDN